MSQSFKVGLALSAICLSAIILFFYSRSSERSSDFSREGTWYQCNGCKEMMRIPVGQVAAFYENNPDRRGSPMTCPQCEKGLVFPGNKCPTKGCFYQSAVTLSDGRPACPICESPLP